MRSITKDEAEPLYPYLDADSISAFEKVVERFRDDSLASILIAEPGKLQDCRAEYRAFQDVLNIMRDVREHRKAEEAEKE